MWGFPGLPLLHPYPTKLGPILRGSDDVIPLASGFIEIDPREELVVNNVRLGDSDWSSELMDLDERSEGADLEERSVQFVSKFEV